MNNILSEATIQKINNYDAKQVALLFDYVLSDPYSSKRRTQRRGVSNRAKLIASTKYIPLGRDSDGIPVLIRPESRNKVDAEILTNIKIHKDYPNIIASNKSGYLSGVTIESRVKDDPTLIKAKTFTDDNFFDSVFNELVRKCCMYGKKALRLYFEQGTKDVTVTYLEPWNYEPFYSISGKLVGVLQWTSVVDTPDSTTGVKRFRVSFTTESEDLYFISDSNAEGLEMDTEYYPAVVADSVNDIDYLEGVRPHGFKGVPVVEFVNNVDGLGDVEKSLDGQDARDELMSKSSTTWGAFADILMRDKTLDAEELNFEEFKKALRDYGLVTGDIDFIARSYEAYQDLFKHMQLLQDDIYETSNSYNANSLGGDGDSPTAYQIQQKMKLLIDSTVDTENQFKKSFRELFKLVLSAGVATPVNNDYKNLKIVFQHTIPEDKMQTLVQMVEAGTTPSMKMTIEAGGYDYETYQKQIIEQTQFIDDNMTQEERDKISNL